MIYLFLIFLFYGTMLLYFRAADHFSIIDKPNQRSSHTVVTIRGGGIIFYLAVCFYFIWSGFRYPFFFVGLSAMALISFMDDIWTLSNRLRISVHILSVGLLLQETHLFQQSWYFIIVAIVVAVGIVNAYNFMDGINGITTAYSFAILFLLWIANQESAFIDENLFYFVGAANFVFAFFNFRKKARCFAGDVGSVSMAFIIIFSVFLLIQQTHNALYILFLSVYGIDAGLTILYRLLKKENIFEAHRTHLYQYLSNEVKVNPLLVSLSYALLQLIIGVGVLLIQQYSTAIQLGYGFAIALILILLYTTLRQYILKHYIKS